MEINYIILAHKNPEQLSRLISVLNEPWTKFYIHIDKKIEINPFLLHTKEFTNVVFLPEDLREIIVWGDIGIVKATLNALYQILLDKRKGYCILLSGQDYPIQTNENIHDMLLQNYGNNYITTFPIPNGIWEFNGKNRIYLYKINKSVNRKHFLFLASIFDREFYSRETFGKLNFLRKTGKLRIAKKIFSKRRFPNGLIPFGGSQWWAFPIESITEILKFHEANPQYYNYHRYTLIPDEIFFHSIIKSIQFPGKILPSLTYANWSRKTGDLPATLCERDFSEIKRNSETKLFARKFDQSYDSAILTMIDEKIRI